MIPPSQIVLGGVMSAGDWINSELLLDLYVRGVHEGDWPDAFTSLNAIVVDEWDSGSFDALSEAAWPAAALISTVTTCVLRELIRSGDVRVQFRHWDEVFDLAFVSPRGSASNSTDPCRDFLTLPFGTSFAEDAVLCMKDALGLVEQELEPWSGALEVVAQSGNAAWLTHGGSCPKHADGVFPWSFELLADFVVDWAVKDPALNSASESLREEAWVALDRAVGVRAALAAIGSPVDPVSVAQAVSAKASAILESGDLGQVGFVIGLDRALTDSELVYFPDSLPSGSAGAWIQELVLEDDLSSDSEPTWGELDETIQVLIVEQLLRVMDEHPACLPLALIARHEGTKPEALTLVAGSAAVGVAEALDMNHAAPDAVRAFAVLERSVHGVRGQRPTGP